MADTLKVRAVEGRMLQYEGTKPGYVGYRAATADDDVHHAIPCSVVDERGNVTQADKRFTRTGVAEDVPNTVYYRTAIRVGDVEQVSDEELRNALVSKNGEN